MPVRNTAPTQGDRAGTGHSRLLGKVHRGKGGKKEKLVKKLVKTFQNFLKLVPLEARGVSTEHRAE